MTECDKHNFPFGSFWLLHFISFFQFPGWCWRGLWAISQVGLMICQPAFRGPKRPKHSAAVGLLLTCVGVQERAIPAEMRSRIHVTMLMLALSKVQWHIEIHAWKKNAWACKICWNAEYVWICHKAVGSEGTTSAEFGPETCAFTSQIAVRIWWIDRPGFPEYQYGLCKAFCTVQLHSQISQHYHHTSSMKTTDPPPVSNGLT